METEKRLAEYIVETKYEDLPTETIDFTRGLLLRVLGTTVAGSAEEGVETMVDLVKDWGGKEEATILTYGNKVPAQNAVLVNSIMARALDYEDGISPGAHLGASAIPTAISASELAGGCSGREFLSAIVLGIETAARMNSVSDYDGFDPTGIASVFGSAATAGRIIGLNSAQMLHALALAFNKSGGSFQCNIDGSLAVRVVQGFVSQNGIICAQLAKRDITGPQNFIEGIYGYLHLYGRDKFQPGDVIKDLGTEFRMQKILCKKYPSCGSTLNSTEAALELVGKHDFSPEDVEHVEVKVTPHSYKLCGHQFKIGENPRVDAQFSIQYCVANAILRRNSILEHFEETNIRALEIMDLVKRISVLPDPALVNPELAVPVVPTDVKVTTKKGQTYHRFLALATGMPGKPLSKEEHIRIFKDCISYAKRPLPKENIKRIISLVDNLEEVDDVRKLIPLLIT